MLNIPVVLFLYKKLAFVEVILSEVCESNPSKVYIIMDCPEDSSVKLRQDEIKEIISNFNSAIPFQVVHPGTHLGIRTIIQFGLGKVFETEEKVIVLEDDTIPTSLFFQYCKKMLIQFENNSTIGCVNGSNLGIKAGKEHYYKSKVSLPFWGWATWKNRWQRFPRNYDFWMQFRAQESNCGIVEESTLAIFDRFVEKDKSWDVKWAMYLFANSLETVFPGENLISNVGYTKEATYTNVSNSKFSDLAAEESIFEEGDFEKEIKLENEYMLKMNELIQEMARRNTEL